MLKKITFAESGEKGRRHREHNLAPGTQQENVYLLRSLLPTFGTRPFNKVLVHRVHVWWAKHADHPVRRRNTYFLLSNVFRYGIRWGYLKASPCQVGNAGADVSKPRPVHTADEFEAVVRRLESELQRALRCCSLLTCASANCAGSRSGSARKETLQALNEAQEAGD